jgi:hypothetical protein
MLCYVKTKCTFTPNPAPYNVSIDVKDCVNVLGLKHEQLSRARTNIFTFRQAPRSNGKTPISFKLQHNIVASVQGTYPKLMKHPSSSAGRDGEIGLLGRVERIFSALICLILPENTALSGTPPFQTSRWREMMIYRRMSCRKSRQRLWVCCKQWVKLIQQTIPFLDRAKAEELEEISRNITPPTTPTDELALVALPQLTLQGKDRGPQRLLFLPRLLIMDDEVEVIDDTKYRVFDMTHLI